MSTDATLNQAANVITLFAVAGLPVIKPGDDLAVIITQAVSDSKQPLAHGDILVVAHKIVSKAEGALIRAADVVPSDEARALAQQTGRDPRHCQVILDQSRDVLYTNGAAIITEHKLGFVTTSSGVDRSNSGSPAGDMFVLLPQDPDASAERIRAGLKRDLGVQVAVIISDTFGRPWRAGSVLAAVGLAGIQGLIRESAKDLFGRPMHYERALADEVAAAAGLLQGEADEGSPVIVVRGLRFGAAGNGGIRDLLRPSHEDQVWYRKSQSDSRCSD